jgi:hypothetical protein
MHLALLMRRIVWRAAVTAAQNPRVQAKAAEVYTTQVKPRAEETWARAKPVIDAKRAELKDVASETPPLKRPLAFSRRAAASLVRTRPTSKSENPPHDDDTKS